MKPAFAVLVLALVSGITGCGERDQVIEPQSEKRYQGKRDGKPWENDPPEAQLRGGTWNKGDRQTWEDQIKRRGLLQNERSRG